MKRVLQILILLIVTMSFTVVNAAYAYRWTVDGENLTRGGDAIKGGTAKWIESDEYSGGVLVLENYHGGQLKIACYGTGLGHTFAVKLVGDNSITVDNGVGIIANEAITFIGDGSLTISAAVPIGSGFVKNGNNSVDIEKMELSGNTTIKITPSVEKVVVPASSEETNKEESIVEKKAGEEENVDLEEEDDETTVEGISTTNYLFIIMCFVVVLLVVAFTIMLINKKRS